MCKIQPLIFLTILLCGSILMAQPTVNELPKVADHLDFMVGEWEGAGWMMNRAGRQTSMVKESVSCKLDCTILAVEGLGTKQDSLTGDLKVVHEAFGVIYVDTEQDAIMMRAYKEDGVVETEITVLEPKVIQWTMELPNNSAVRYTVDFTTDKEWKEVGEFSRDGETWMTFMGTHLHKVE